MKDGKMNMPVLTIMQLTLRRKEYEVDQRGCIFSLNWMYIRSKLDGDMFNFERNENF